jgi:predicted dehydrogenase
MRKLKGVIIGCGAMAREHLAAVADLPNADIVALCDLSPIRAEAAADRFGVPAWYTSHQELLANVRPDLVHITTPPSAHFSIAEFCLSAGLNVLCEKPITVDHTEFSKLKHLALRNNCLLIENQNFRFHSSIRRIIDLVDAGTIGELVDLQVCICLNLFGVDSPYVDANSPHATSILSGGVIGDFLPHIAYLTYMFTNSVIDLRTIWVKRKGSSPLSTDEFRCIIKGERATAYVSFSGNSQPDGFWVRVTGTKAQAEANLFEPPRLVLRRVRSGEPALMRLVDGINEAGSVLKGSVVGFWRKLAGTSSYDGVAELIKKMYVAVETGGAQPVALDEIDETVRLVDRFAAGEFKL